MFIVPQPSSLYIFAFLSMHIPPLSCLHCSPGKADPDLRCSLEDPAVFQACCAHRRSKVKGQNKGVRAAVPLCLWDGSPPTPDSELEGYGSQRQGWLYLFSTYRHLHSPSALPCAQRLTSRDHIATSLSCFQVGVASERHHHERRQEGRDEGIVPFLPVLVP